VKGASFALLVAVLSSSMPAVADPGRKNIVDTAAAADNFKTLVSALQAAGLTGALEGKGPFTVFAPTDGAFSKLPAGILESLLKPENKQKLESILLYHVIAGEVTSAQVVKLTSAKTLEGQDLRIAVDNGVVMVNDTKTVHPDILASNGVIHVIDTVLLPKEQVEKEKL
jgi:uncharacterized surface protein with fasciclin (FAS1) repeats